MSCFCGNLDQDSLNRLAVLRRYSAVAFELPDWAREALESKMGSVEVSARDSFELYLTSLKCAEPKFDYVSFQKKFVEIFQRRAFKVLKKIIENREKNQDYYVSNDYFWQEFRELFEVNLKSKRTLGGWENTIWNSWNKYVKGIFGVNKNALKVGVNGVPKLQMLNSPKQKSSVQEIKWS